MIDQKDKTLSQDLDRLETEIKDRLSLVVSEAQLNNIAKFIHDYRWKLENDIKDMGEEKDIQKKFGNFVRNVMSTIETVHLDSKQFTAIRRLVLDIIYDCQDCVIPVLTRNLSKN